MRKIVWAAPALQDLNAIHCFIARDSEHYALSFLEELVSQPENLWNSPRWAGSYRSMGERIFAN